MNQTPLVDILLSTFNGADYLRDLLDSISVQTCKEWRLLIRDDGSSDATLQIIDEYSSKFKEKMLQVESGGKNLGACQSFARLLLQSTAEYVMFCDQDDVWLPNKIEITLRRMKETEFDNRNLPILIHTDLMVVDRNLKVLSPSFHQFQNINPELKSLNNLIIMNVVTGCTMMINQKLRDYVPLIPETAMIHDWWITLVASVFGKIEHVKAPTILYRQHGRNEIGAVSYLVKYFIPRMPDLRKSVSLSKRIAEQAGSLLEMYKDKLSDEEFRVLDNFSKIFKKKRFERLTILIKFKIFGSGFIRNIEVMMLFFLIKRTKTLNRDV